MMFSPFVDKKLVRGSAPQIRAMSERDATYYDDEKSAKEIPTFIKQHSIDMRQFQPRDPEKYNTLNDFIARRLAAGARKMSKSTRENPNVAIISLNFELQI